MHLGQMKIPLQNRSINNALPPSCTMPSCTMSCATAAIKMHTAIPGTCTWNLEFRRRQPGECGDNVTHEDARTTSPCTTSVMHRRAAMQSGDDVIHAVHRQRRHARHHHAHPMRLTWNLVFRCSLAMMSRMRDMERGLVAEAAASLLLLMFLLLDGASCIGKGAACAPPASAVPAASPACHAWPKASVASDQWRR